MTTKNRPQFANALEMQKAQNKAISQARSLLSAKGIEYPYRTSEMTDEEFYGLLLSYSEQEAALVVQFMRQPSGPRPLELDNVKPKTDWGSYYDK